MVAHMQIDLYKSKPKNLAISVDHERRRCLPFKFSNRDFVPRLAISNSSSSPWFTECRNLNSLASLIVMQ